MPQLPEKGFIKIVAGNLKQDKRGELEGNEIVEVDSC